MDISESGRQIGEKLFVLLDPERQEDLVKYIFNRKHLDGISNTSLRSVSEYHHLQYDSAQPLTEIQAGDLYFCLEERKVCVGSRKIELTAKEFDALHLLIVNRKRVLTFETIAYHVWGEEYVGVTTKTIHNLLSRLRQKLQIDSAGPKYIKSVRGVGYKFESE